MPAAELALYAERKPRALALLPISLARIEDRERRNEKALRKRSRAGPGRLGRRYYARELFELFIGKHRAEIRAAFAQHSKDLRVPFEAQLPRAIIGHGQFARLGIAIHIEIQTLMDDERFAARGHDDYLRAAGERLLDGLITGDQFALSIGEHGPARAVLFERKIDEGPAAVRAAVGVAIIKDEIANRS